MKTTTTCTECGDEIPASLLKDALCVACRYAGNHKQAESLDDYGKPVPSLFDLQSDKASLDEYEHRTEDEAEAADLSARKEIIAGLLRMLSSGNGDTDALGRRLLVVAYLSGALPDCPTHAALAKRLNISPGRVTQIISEIKGVLPSLARCKGRQSKKD